jgi:hypothetical protein
VEVPSGEDDVLKPDASVTRQRKSTGDDAEVGEASSAELVAPNPISSNVPEQTDPSVTDHDASTNPSVGGHRCKCPPHASKWK